MIKVILRGGLGNQMFQYAAGIGVAKQNNTSLAIDATYLNDRSPRGNFTRRNYDLDIFEKQPPLTLLSTISKKIPIPGLWIGLDFGGALIGNFFRQKKFLIEKKDYVFDEKIFNAGKSAVLWGFWQSEKYFENAKNEVRTAFQFRSSNNEAIIKAKKEIENSNSVALHVRRGDYLLPKYAKIYGATDISYYDAAITYIIERITSPKFFVFSDDIAWCKENIKTSALVVFMDDDSAGPKASGHLELMSLCKHNIIANSSFSWWGAWLNANPEKIVVAPKKWTADVSQCEDMSEGWIWI